MTLKKQVTKYKIMRKWMVEVLRKSDSRGDKIDRVNSIRITKSINLLLFCTLLGSVVIKGDFSCSVHLWKSLWLNRLLLHNSLHLIKMINLQLFHSGNCYSPHVPYRLSSLYRVICVVYSLTYLYTYFINYYNFMDAGGHTLVRSQKHWHSTRLKHEYVHYTDT